MDISQILISPVVTEKAFAAQEKGKYAFRVNKDATKTQVKEAVKTFYGISPKSVNIVLTIPKYRIAGRGKVIRKRAVEKRAIVTLPKGKTMDVTKFSKAKKK